MKRKVRLKDIIAGTILTLFAVGWIPFWTALVWFVFYGAFPPLLSIQGVLALLIIIGLGITGVIWTVFAIIFLITIALD